MTSERRLLIGFDDIRAVTLECKACGARLTIAPEKASADALAACPQCRETWVPGNQASGNAYGTPVTQFLHLLPELVAAANPNTPSRYRVRVLLEIAEPS